MGLGRKDVAVSKLQDRYPVPRKLYIEIDGSDLPNGVANKDTAAVDRGVDAVTAYDDGANTATIVFNEALPDAKPQVQITLLTAGDVKVQVSARSKTAISYVAVKSSDGTTAVDDVDVMIEITYADSVDVA